MQDPNSANQGDLVKLKDDPHEVVGVIIEVAPDCLTKRIIYFVSWVCDICDDMWSESWHLEVVCK